MDAVVHLIDDSWIDATPVVVAQVVSEPGRWAQWWPNLELRVSRDRGIEGIQWEVRGRFRGTAEIWLEPLRSGVVLHHYLRLDPTGEAPSRRRARRLNREFAWQAKRVFWRLKDDLEAASGPC